MLRKMVKQNVTEANEALFSGMMDMISRGDYFIEKKNPFSYSANVITVKKGTVITLDNGGAKSFILDTDIDLSVNDLDSGAFGVGKDYYIYLVDDGADGVFKISLNSTFPAGCNADNSRKIGGFHYGHIRKVNTSFAPIDSEGTVFGGGAINWEDNVTTGVIPNSVWDLKNRPKCSPEGMAKIGDIWVDIYLSSAAETITSENGVNGLHVAGGKLQSKYGQYPVTGTEGVNWYGFTELAARTKKRLLSHNEWIQAAAGNPEGQDTANDYGWTKTTNTSRARTGVRVNASSGSYDPANGIKPSAISAYNIVDTVGNVWERNSDLATRWDAEGSAWGWKDELGVGKGECYRHDQELLISPLAGGY